MPERQIYLLSPRQLSPETIAVAFAKTSRSPDSFREIAAGLTEEKSAQFHEKWVVGYGHASVAEHAVLHLAFENVSRLAIESIESNRLASYTEKSTRYQKWSVDDFFTPRELDVHPLREQYVAACSRLFQTYVDSLGPVRDLVLARAQRRPGESDEAMDRRLRSQYVDVCRFLLPAASLANVGMTANARVLESMIRKMLSHRLMEVREIGEQVKTVATSEVPTLVKYADAVPYLSETVADLDEMRPDIANGGSEACTLIDYDRDGEKKVLAAALYRFGEMPMAAALAYLEGLSEAGCNELVARLMQRLDAHDVPLRELEYCTYTFDLVMDQGAYAAFKRHRMMTQTAQKLSTRLGYAVPQLIAEAGQRPEYDAAMQAAAEVYEKLYEFNPDVAQYVVPNAYKRRVLARFNLREAYAFCQLRSATNAHFSIRRIARQVHDAIRQVHPRLAGYMRLPDESADGLSERYFAEG
ncbi:MAG: FAD-dependent thymidylate synthase [Anaerolineae bacterium]